MTKLSRRIRALVCRYLDHKPFYHPAGWVCLRQCGAGEDVRPDGTLPPSLRVL